MTVPIEPWRATCIQMPSRVARTASSRAEAWAIISGNIERGLALIDRCVQAGTPPRLVMLPEFAFQGPPRGESVDEWISKACSPVPGEITEPFQAKAAEHGIYIGGNQFEVDPEWPHRHFNTSWLIDPRGELVLRYRRIHTAQWVSPHDLLDAYLDRYGLEGLFPVADTELGRVGMLACGEILVPESARVLMLRGAEILLHPTNEPYSEGEEAAKVVTAAANMMYVVSANVAGPIGFSDGEPMNARDPVSGAPVQGGHSRIVSFSGTTLSLIEGPEESISASAVLDVEALRAARRDRSMSNQILRTRFEVFRPFYDSAEFWPANAFLDEPMLHWSATERVAEAAVANLIRRGVAARPGTAGQA
jgi:predicted amidohydrolase